MADGRAHPPELRARALALYRGEVGPAEAARRVGVPPATVRGWAHRAGVSSERAAHARAGAKAARLTWAQRRAEVARDSGDAAAELLARMRKARKPREAADWSRAFAIAVDKAQLLGGGATGRVEVSTAEEREQRVRELRDELAARRAG